MFKLYIYILVVGHAGLFAIDEKRNSICRFHQVIPKFIYLFRRFSSYLTEVSIVMLNIGVNR